MASALTMTSLNMTISGMSCLFEKYTSRSLVVVPRMMAYAQSEALAGARIGLLRFTGRFVLRVYSSVTRFNPSVSVDYNNGDIKGMIHSPPPPPQKMIGAYLNSVIQH